LFDNKFNPQQAGALMQTGGGNYLSPSDLASGGNFNFEQSAAEQHKRSGGDDGFGNIATLALLAAGGYGLGSLAGLWGAGAGAAAGAAVPGSIAAQWAALEGAPTLMMGGELAAGGAGAFASDLGFAGLPELLGNAGGYGFTSTEPLGFAPELGSPIENSGIVSEAFSPTTSTVNSELLGPPQASEMEGLYIDDYGGGTNSMGDFVNGKGNRSLLDSISNTMRDLGIDRETAAKLTQGGSNMYNTMTTPIGGRRDGLFQAPSPLSMLFQGAGALDSMNTNRQARSYLENARNGLNGNASNPNRARGDYANQAWQQNYQDPMAGYNEFMTGAGREFTDQARAQAAKSGRRGGYLNSGKMQSDLASLFMKNQFARGDSLARGFEKNENDNNARAAYDTAMLSLLKNQNAPLFQMGSNIGMQFALSDLFGRG
jgi:hypothetical protein